MAFRCQLGHWYPHLFLLMPDHCHALLSFPPDRGVKKTIADWKHWTAVRFGIHWQADFFDHRLRTPEAFEEKAHYILQNPVRAGLTMRAEEWPYVWRGPDVFTGMKR